MALWTPANLGATLLAWYDAQDAATITKNGSNEVSAWADKSVSSGARTGRAYIATQADGGRTPIYDAVGFNGKPAFQHQGYRWLTNTALAKAAPYTVVGIGRRDYNNGYSGPTRLIGQPNSYNSIATRGADANSPYFGELANDGWSSTDSIVPNPVLFIASITGTDVNQLHVDTVQAQLDYPHGSAALNGIQIGGTANGEGHNGPIGEVVVISGVLSAADRQKLEGYILWKWGYQARLPSSHPYKGAAPQTGSAAKFFLVGSQPLSSRYVGKNKAARYVGKSAEWVAG